MTFLFRDEREKQILARFAYLSEQLAEDPVSLLRMTPFLKLK